MARPLGVAQVHHLWRSALPSALNLLFFLPLAPATLPPALWILFPSLNAFCGSTCFLFSPTLVRLSWRLSGQTNRREDPERARRHVAGFCLPGLIPVLGKVFLRGAQRGLRLNGGTATQIFAPLCRQCLMCFLLFLHHRQRGRTHL